MPSRFFVFSSMHVESHQVPMCMARRESSPVVMMKVLSSANWDILWAVPSTEMPLYSLSWVMSRVMTSVTRRKSSGERGQPWATPEKIGKGALR